MDKFLEVEFSGWTATPRLPFILSGNSLCMPTPSYSLILGIIGCCLGRIVDASELKLGFRYTFDFVASDLETRQRLEFDGKRVRAHSKGSDAYVREFHTSPSLKIWLNRLDWSSYFNNPVGTPSLGRSQDILKILKVNEVEAFPVEKGSLSGSLLPFDDELQAGGQLIQLAESYQENDEVGGGRTPVKSMVFISIPHDNHDEVFFKNLFKVNTPTSETFYLHEFNQ